MCARYKKTIPRAFSLLLLTLPLASIAFLHAQQPLARNAMLDTRAEMVLRVDVDLVVLPVSVTDWHSRVVSGLRPQHFEVYEDGVRQQIINVSEEDTPISVGFVFDGSGSMANKIDLCKQAVLAFTHQAHPDDEYFLVEFNDRPVLLASFTSRVDRILGFVGAARGGGRTALYDAIYLALAKMETARYSRRVLLVLSDGADNASRYTQKNIRTALLESDVQIYTIGVFEPLPYRNTWEEQIGPTNMRRLAESSGGRGFVVTNPAHLPDLAATISRELRTQYAISYAPSNRTHDGHWRKLRVKVKAPPGIPSLEARTRSGYYAPAF